MNKGRNVKITNSQGIFLKNLTKNIEKVMGVENYLITEQQVADKYKKNVEDIIFLEKQAIPIEIQEKNIKIRRAKILNNLYKNGLDYYNENTKGKNSDFTDALIINQEGKLLFLLRNKNDNLFPNKYCLVGGHQEKALSPESNIKKEIKEETGLDVLECNLAHVKNINGNKNKIYYFICTLPREYQIVLNEREHSNYKWMSLKEIINTPKEQFMFDLKDILLKEIFKISNVK